MSFYSQNPYLFHFGFGAQTIAEKLASFYGEVSLVKPIEELF
jgi:hypothetical protein